MVCRRNAEPGARADQSFDRRAEAPDAAVHPRRASRPVRPGSRIIPRRSVRPRCAKRSPRGSRAGTVSRPSIAATQVLPVLGSREALFAFAQTVVDGSRAGATVVMPNPFYQIYEGAALLAGAEAVLRQCRRRTRLRARVARRARRRLGAHAIALRLLARQPDRTRHDPGGVAVAVRALRSPRLRHRRRRVLFGSLLRRGATAAGRARRGAGGGRDGFPAARRRSAACRSAPMRRAALGLRRRRCGAGEGVPALPDVPRLGDVPGGRGGQHRRLARRGARARQSRALRGQVRHTPAAPRRRAARARCRTRRSICGRRRRSTTPSSPSASSPSRR